MAWSDLQRCLAEAYLALAKLQWTQLEQNADDSLDKAQDAIEQALVSQGSQQLGPLGIATRKAAHDIEEFATMLVRGADA